ncbi:PLC-like phosphodiesterase [Lindgomyces ingoldianus]|uniref:PLC-like phosphodiesterase n=1 Tax=Lindgomyces ingoldianus TaxID=673940 RepID=A0ACB6QBG0_9PLEO|nr:PLC-like phosphodiesterase [Lindgomyces ingoldianus]KAF2464259.1 PLC-like phosphodiesterase [Lindgomyces ingoldianus]
MSAKAVDVYSYISLPGYSVQFVVSHESITHTQADNFSCHHLEIESLNISGTSDAITQFKWTVYNPNGGAIASKYNDIHLANGKLETGKIASPETEPPIKISDVIITSCIYSAGPGNAGLTNRHQCSITITSISNRHWMKSVAPPGSTAAQLPFSRFVLPSPHDCGMNSLQTCESILAVADLDMVHQLKNFIPNANQFKDTPDQFLLDHLREIVYGTAITQKESIATMLALGARYFELRPAKLLPFFQKASNLPNAYYFHHSLIPGISFRDFLSEVVGFLDEERMEIVVLHVRYDNIVAECERPSMSEVFDMLDSTCEKVKNPPLRWEDGTCFSRSIDEFRQLGIRLIVLFEAEKYDSYNPKAYATLTPTPILECFEAMTTEGQESTDLTVLQCQATSQAIGEVMIESIRNSKAAGSCLMSTKARNDMVLLPWIKENLEKKLRAERLCVVMDDWVDAGLVDVCVQISRRRLGVGG